MSAAAKLLASAGKAAVIHPTGTGKSFIAFQLAADHPGENILWLSPSEYIFATQRESLRRQAPEVSLAHVHFYTYAKLLRLTEEDLAAIADLHPVHISSWTNTTAPARRNGPPRCKSCWPPARRRSCWAFRPPTSAISITSATWPMNCSTAMSPAK